MVLKVLNAITNQLYAVYGNQCTYYLQVAEQKIKKPCFTIDAMMPSVRSSSPVLYQRKVPVVIHYFGKQSYSITTKATAYKMAEQVIQALQYLPFQGGLIRAQNMHWQIVDGVLQFFMTYQFTTKRESVPGQSMEDLNLQQNLNERNDG